MTEKPTPPKVRGIALKSDPPYVGLAERYESRGENMLIAGVGLISVAVAFFHQPPAWTLAIALAGFMAGIGTARWIDYGRVYEIPTDDN